MASIINRNGRWRALVRMAGHSRCATFATRTAAKSWAGRIESEIEQLRARGVIPVPDKTLADLIERYAEELYPIKQWGRSKSADLRALTKGIGQIKADQLTSKHVTDHFQKRQRDGAGAVTVSAQIGYLIDVLRTARGLWHMDVNVQAAQDARLALSRVGLVGKSNTRDRRVSDAELALLVTHFKSKHTGLPMADILQFCVASAMRISEVCRVKWADLDETARTIVIRDRKHPREKHGNNQTVPLLAARATGFDALEIIQRQARTANRIFPYSSRTVSTYFTRAAAKLELADLQLHDLRHEAVSRLFAAGYRIEEVALVSGHRDWAMLRRYTHVKATDLHRRAQ